jgi:hypothetical protein
MPCAKVTVCKGPAVGSLGWTNGVKGKVEERLNPSKLVSVSKKIIINGQNEGWLQEACKLASARTPFTLVKFDYMAKENFSFCRVYIEQDYGFKHESEGALVHHFNPPADFFEVNPQ